MGDRRFMLVFVIALIVAIGSGFGAYSMLRSAKANVAPTAQVIVAAADIPDGHLIAPEDLRMVVRPQAAIPAGAFTRPDSIVGRVTRMPMLAGEAMSEARLAPVGSGAGLEVRIARGKRAMAVRIDDVAGLAGIIQPNSHVDVLVIVAGPGGAVDRARLFMSNMRVLSVGTQVDRATPAKPDGVATMATLEVTPAEAERLAMAVNAGKIQLVLRGFGDPDTTTSLGTSLHDLPLGIARAVEAEKPAPRAPQVMRSPAASAPSPSAATVAPLQVEKAPETVTVQVYRGSTVTSSAVSAAAKKDTIRP